MYYTCSKTCASVYNPKISVTTERPTSHTKTCFCSWVFIWGRSNFLHAFPTWLVTKISEVLLAINPTTMFFYSKKKEKFSRNGIYLVVHRDLVKFETSTYFLVNKKKVEQYLLSPWAEIFLKLSHFIILWWSAIIELGAEWCPKLKLLMS